MLLDSHGIKVGMLDALMVGVLDALMDPVGLGNEKTRIALG